MPCSRFLLKIAPIKRTRIYRYTRLNVGAGLLANAVYQSQRQSLTHRIREQARSHILHCLHSMNCCRQLIF